MLPENIKVEIRALTLTANDVLVVTLKKESITEEDLSKTIHTLNKGVLDFLDEISPKGRKTPVFCKTDDFELETASKEVLEGIVKMIQQSRKENEIINQSASTAANSGGA